MRARESSSAAAVGYFALALFPAALLAAELSDFKRRVQVKHCKLCQATTLRKKHFKHRKAHFSCPFFIPRTAVSLLGTQS